MKFIVLLSVLLFWLSPDVAAGAGTERSETNSVTTEQVAGNSANPEDDSQVKADSVAHKSGYSEKPNFGSSSSVPAQLEEDDRVKEPVIRFAAVDRGLKP